MLKAPNMVIPLASSYNERGIQGFTNTVTNGIDQRKVNSLYKPIRNAITGQMTLYLVNRPGVTLSGQSFGTSGQVGYFVIAPPGQSGTSGLPWVISKNGNNNQASSSAASTTILASASYVPAYVDKTAISGAENVVLQLQVDQATAQRVYYSTAIGTWTEITDGDFTGLIHRGKMEFMDGYPFILDSMNRIYNGDLNSLANWTAGNFITKQIRQDYPRGLMKFKNQLLAMGDETMEVFTNQGSPSGSPLQVQKSAFKRVGINVGAFTVPGVTTYYSTLGERLYFAGKEAGGSYSVCVYAYDGETVQKVSTPAIESIIGESAAIYSINTVGFNGMSAIAFCLDLLTATTQRWLMFFPDQNEWFEWNSTVFTPINTGEWFLGVGTNQHKVYFFNYTDNWQDNGTDYTMTHQFKLPKSDDAQAIMSYCGVKGDTARSASSLSVQFSDDDWQTIQTARTIDMTKKQKRLQQCGMYYDRGVKLTHTGNIELRLENFFARVQ